MLWTKNVIPIVVDESLVANMRHIKLYCCIDGYSSDISLEAGIRNTSATVACELPLVNIYFTHLNGN